MNRATSILTAPLRAGTWRRTLHLLLDFPIGFAGLVYAMTVAIAACLSVVGTGLPLLGACVLGGRGLARLERRRVSALLGEPIADPPPFRPTRPGLGGWIRAAIGDRPGWRGLGYLVLLGLWSPVSTGLTIAFWLPALILVTYPIWYVPFAGLSGQTGIQLGVPGSWNYIDSWPEIVLAAVAGALLLPAGAFVGRGLARLDRALARALLAPVPLRQRVHDLEESRSQAVGSAANELRRIERDLHDGAQVHMVAVAMDLGMARAKLAADPAAAAELIAQAHEGAKQAITELRDLARGIHPAVLTDRGLAGALPTLTASCRTPVDLTVTVDERPAAAIETIAYYAVAELLTNAGKHSRATRIQVAVTRHGDRLLIDVTDDGIGGANAGASGGLHGLAERLRPVDGTMTIASPPGGPTTIRLELPCAS